jgi:hypothetical protein
MCHYMTLSNMQHGVLFIAIRTITLIFFSNAINSGTSTGQILTPFVDKLNDEKNECLPNRRCNHPNTQWSPYATFLKLNN